MINITTKEIEKVFTSIHEGWQNEVIEMFGMKLIALENSNRIIGDSRMSEEDFALRTVMGLEYYITRFASEEYDLDTAKYFKSKLDEVKINLSKGSKNDVYMKMSRRQITFLQIAMGLDISYPTELLPLYAKSLGVKNGICFEDVANLKRKREIVSR